MGEAIPGGHEILNHLGAHNHVTQHTVKALDMRHYLRRDRPTGLLALKPHLIDVLSEMEYGTPLMRELGPDCSGPNVPMCRCAECRRKESDIDHTLTPEAARRQIHEQADAAVRTVTLRRLKPKRRS